MMMMMIRNGTRGVVDGEVRLLAAGWIFGWIAVSLRSVS